LILADASSCPLPSIAEVPNRSVVVSPLASKNAFPLVGADALKVRLPKEDSDAKPLPSCCALYSTLPLELNEVVLLIELDWLYVSFPLADTKPTADIELIPPSWIADEAITKPLPSILPKADYVVFPLELKKALPVNGLIASLPALPELDRVPKA
jgi:hypothetical protein